MRHDRARPRVLVLFVALFGVLLVAQPGGDGVTTALDDVVLLLAAAFATGAAAWRATTLSGRARRSWAVMAAAFGAAALGEAIWGWYELVAKRETPFPSLADAAYLSFPVLALVALLLRPSAALRRKRRARSVLDGLLVAGSLFNISWVTALGSVYHAGGQGPLAFGIGIAYPASDVVLLTLTLVVLAHARTRQGLVPLVWGLMALALSDSAFSYFTADGNYQSGNLLDVGYLVGYLLLAEAALRDRAPSSSTEADADSLPSLLLPYLPAAVGVGIAVWQFRPGLHNPAVVVGSVLLVLLLARQLLTLLDNQRLLKQVLAQDQALKYQAFHDPLTSLANRTLFTDRLTHALHLHRRDQRPIAVLLADLDDFKSVNDSLGHPTGDELLLRVAERLQGTTRAGDTVARLGGDEFAILVEDGADASSLAQRILLALDQPVTLQGRAVQLSASIGIAVLEGDAPSLNAAELMKRADIAMYQAKRSAKGTAKLYETGVVQPASDEIDLRADLTAAVKADEVDVHFQPIFSTSGELLGFEALSRWRRHGTPVPPDVFIPAAERAGVLPLLDEQVLRKTLAFKASVDLSGTSLLVTVNTDVTQLCDTALPVRLGKYLSEYGIDPRQLAVEIPESRVIPDPIRVGAALADLRALGVKVALDDFGVGWSSLERLQAMAPSIVKIDRCFVEPLDRSDARTDLVAGMIELAHRVGALVIAEGVERPRQLETLRELGCDAVQGFLLGSAMPASLAAQLCSSVRRPPVPAPRSALVPSRSSGS